MVICGAILLAAGLGLIIYGFSLNNSAEAQLNALFSSGSVDPGTVWIVVGIVALAAGIILLILGLTKKPVSHSTGAAPEPVRRVEKTVCPHCGRTLTGSPEFCTYCGRSVSAPPPRRDNVCPYCENILPPGVAFCPACGKPAASGTTPRPTPVPPAPAPRPAPEPAPVYRSSSSGLWSTPSDSDL